MKTFQTLKSTEAVERLKNWLVMNFKYTVEDIDNKLACMLTTHGQQKINDLAFYIQYAMIERVEYFTILTTVDHDYRLYNKQETPFKTFCYEMLYHTKATMAKLPKRINAI